jgi:steroid 5-alpha reductase family enzyme
LTDITYCVSFAALALYAAFQGDIMGSQGKIILIALVLVWALRLGRFLFSRVTKLGKDDRFDNIRTNRKRFFRFFLLQGISSWLISLPILIRMSQSSSNLSFAQVDILEWSGFAIALIGLIIESVADAQKTKFKNKAENRNKIYTGGLYGSIRYPNYLGEIIFWVGIFVACIPFLSGFSWLSVISPIIIILLLLFVSGIPYLEKGRAEKYANDPEYQAYLASSKMIIPGIY